MRAKQRRDAIAQLVRLQGSVAVTELAIAFDVCAETVRTDLAALEADDIVARTHGGAIWPQPLRLRRDEDKARALAARIAVAACDLNAATDATIVLDGGLVSEEIARQLPRAGSLRVVTRSVRVAERLAGTANVELILLPGLVCRRTQSAAGPLTIDMMSRWRADITLVEGRVQAPGTQVWTRCACEVATKRAALEAGRRVVYLDALPDSPHPTSPLTTTRSTDHVLR